MYKSNTPQGQTTDGRLSDKAVDGDDHDDDLYLLIRQAALTPSERRVADVVLTDYPQSALLTAQEVAASAAVSASCVSRFTAKLGYETFGDLREQLREQLRAKLESPRGRLQINTPYAPTPADTLAETVGIDIENLQRVLAMVNHGIFDQLAEFLARTDGTVYVAASKKAGILAEYLSTQLNQIRTSVVLLRIDDTLPDKLLDMNSSDILVAIEPRRATRSLVQLVKLFRQADATVGVLADESLPPVLAQVDFPIPVPVRSNSAFDSYTAFISVINAIVAAVITAAPERAKSRIDHLEQINTEFNTWYDQDKS